MDETFERRSRLFFRLAGGATAAGSLPIMLAPATGLRLATGLTYADTAPGLGPLVGHWGMMVFALGVMMFLAATRKPLRWPATVFATIEKSYIVGAILYCFAIGAPYAVNYVAVLAGDGLMALGGVWYLWQSRRLRQI